MRPFLVSQNDDTVLDLETLEVRKREMQDYCSKQSVSRYLLGYEKKVPLEGNDDAFVVATINAPQLRNLFLEWVDSVEAQDSQF